MAEELKHPTKCRECGSGSLNWFAHKENKSGVQDGRLCMHDVRGIFVLGCDDCSATLAVVSADDIAAHLNTRAQLPSQGGEAVAWARQCDLDESDPAIFVAREEVQESGYVVPLYIHPADQVDGVVVSRELLQDLRDLAFDQVGHHRAAMGAYKQTRQSAMDSVLAQADALLRS